MDFPRSVGWSLPGLTHQETEDLSDLIRERHDQRALILTSDHAYQCHSVKLAR